MNLLNKIFPKRTNYPAQQLTDKQLELIERIDSSLVDAHKGKPIRGVMRVKMTGVPYMQTIRSIDYITDHITLEYGDSYLPRSVALIVDHDGNWIFMYAIREETGSDDITNRLFMDCLGRTNNAR